jgi:hypothetical protein
MTDTLSLLQLDALPDKEFLSLFSGGTALRGLILSLGQKACGEENAQSVNLAPEKEAAS